MRVLLKSSQRGPSGKMLGQTEVASSNPIFKGCAQNSLPTIIIRIIKIIIKIIIEKKKKNRTNCLPDRELEFLRLIFFF